MLHVFHRSKELARTLSNAREHSERVCMDCDIQETSEMKTTACIAIIGVPLCSVSPFFVWFVFPSTSNCGAALRVSVSRHSCSSVS